jgi:DNA-binding transcriptional LysR family regulator
MMGGRTWTHDILDQLSERGYQYKLGLECNERLQVREAVAKNLGVGISYLENLKADVASGRFVVLKGADFRYSMPIYILFSRKRSLSPAGHEFLTWLRQAKKPAQGKRAHETTAKPRKLQLASKS